METIIHDGKTYTVAEIKKDFDVINEYIQSSFCNGEGAFKLPHKAVIRRKYDALKYVFSNFVTSYDYDEKSRLIFQAKEICKKYITVDKSKKPVPKEGKTELEYCQALRFFQTKIMLQVEDLVIAYGNPEWSEIYIQCVPGCNKNVHKSILRHANAEQ